MIIAQTQPAGLSTNEAVFIAIAAAGAAAAFTGLVQYVVGRALIRHRRCATLKALLEEVRQCALAAKIKVESADETFLPMWREEALKKRYIALLENPIWSATMRTPELLPSENLDRLMVFHHRVALVNHDIDAFHKEQCHIEGIARPMNPPASPSDVEHIAASLANQIHRVRALCDQIAPYVGVRELSGLPASFESKIELFGPLADLLKKDAAAKQAQCPGAPSAGRPPPEPPSDERQNSA